MYIIKQCFIALYLALYEFAKENCKLIQTQFEFQLLTNPSKSHTKISDMSGNDNCLRFHA